MKTAQPEKLFFISWMKVSSWKCGAKLRMRIEKVQEINNQNVREGNIFKCQTKPQVKATTFVSASILIYFDISCFIQPYGVVQNKPQSCNEIGEIFSAFITLEGTNLLHIQSQKIILMFWCFWMLTICNFFWRYLISRWRNTEKRESFQKL